MQCVWYNRGGIASLGAVHSLQIQTQTCEHFVWRVYGFVSHHQLPDIYPKTVDQFTGDKVSNEL